VLRASSLAVILCSRVLFACCIDEVVWCAGVAFFRFCVLTYLLFCVVIAERALGCFVMFSKIHVCYSLWCLYKPNGREEERKREGRGEREGQQGIKGNSHKTTAWPTCCRHQRDRQPG
jgi:hypothetical protein